MSDQSQLDVLYIDKDLHSLKTIKELIETEKMSFMGVTIKSQAMEIIIMKNPAVIIVDTQNIDLGNDLFKALRKIGVESQVLIYTENVSEDISYKQQIGLVFALIKKSEGTNLLLNWTKKAIETYQKFHELSTKISSENEVYKKEIEWLIWKQRKEQNNKYSLGKTILETMTHSIFQGMGMGAAVSTIDLIDFSKKEEGDFFKVKKPLLQNLVKNTKPMKLIKERLDKMIEILDTQFEKELLPSNTVYSILSESIQNTESFRMIKNQTISLEEFPASKNLMSNAEFLGLAFRELLTNAYKYSPENSRIYITKGFFQGGISFLFINSISKVTKGIQGIPPELENEIFEPFFRINRIYDERFYQEELGFGTGLSVISRGLHSLGGKLFVYEGIDYVTSREPEKKVIAEMILPGSPIGNS
jgi:DNA-binding response OmpR family regulator